VSWVFQAWQPLKPSTLATAAATPSLGMKEIEAGEAMAKLLREGVAQ
jgi:hypothetical protein